MADPSPQQVVAAIQINDYASLAVIIVVGYDYVLTLSKEIEHIWDRPWTFVSTLFVLARYSGLCFVITVTILGTSFFLGPDSTMYVFLPLFYVEQDSVVINKIKIIDVSTSGQYSLRFLHRDHFQGPIAFLLNAWCFWIFTCAADLVMVLRLWALCNRSMLALGALLTFYAMEVISIFVAAVVMSIDSRNPSQVGVAQVLQLSYCALGKNSPVWYYVPDALQITLATLMCLLNTVQFLKESLRAYTIAKRFQLNRYMRRLVGEGMIYFVVILISALLNMLTYAGSIPGGAWQETLNVLLQSIPSFTLVPRFILSLRELYARDLQGRQGSDIDTAFGLGSHSLSAIMFADGGQLRGTEQGDETQIEEWAQHG